MNNYVVVKAFQDKETGTRYEIGQSYTPSNAERAGVLERGGYIAHETSQAAQEANQTANQAANQQTTQNVEAVTVVNGKVVSLDQARQAAQAAEAAATQTGIQAHHSNHTEAVQAGQVAKQSSAQTQQSTQSIRQVNVQSGGSEMEKAMNFTPADAQSKMQPGGAEAAQSSQAAAQSSQAAAKTTSTKANAKKE